MFVDTRMEQAVPSMQALHRRWVENKALRIGEQHSKWNAIDKQFKSSNAPDYRVRHTTNIVNPIVKTWIAQLLKAPIGWDVIPENMSLKTRRKAVHATRVLQYHQGELRWEYLRQLLAGWAFETGCAWLENGWDPFAGPVGEAVDLNGNPISWPGTEEPMINPVTKNPLTWQQGMVDVHVVPSFQMFTDPAYLGHPDGAPWLCRRSIKSVDWIRQHHGERGRHVRGNANMSEHLILERQFTSLAQGYSHMPMSGAPGDDHGKWEIYDTMYVRPTVEWPDGRLIIKAGDVVLQDSDIPWLQARKARPDRDWNPWVMFACNLVGGRFWPLDIIGDLAGIQHAINMIVSCLIEHFKLLSKPKWMVPHGSLKGIKRISSEPGENVPFNAAYGAPFLSKMEPIGGDSFKILETLFQHADFVSSQHGPSRGDAPKNVKSGIGIQILQEQDEMDLGPIAKLWESSEADVGRKWLQRVGQFWTDDRQVRLAGPDHEMDSFIFNGSDVAACFDVVVKPGSALPKSRTANLAMVEKMVGMGLYDAMNPQHKREMMEMLEVGSYKSRLAADRVDQRRAEFENLFLSEGGMPGVQYYQNHDIHLEEHFNWMKSDEYQRLVTEQPDLHVRMNMHIMMHTMPINQQALMDQNQLPNNPYAGMMEMMGGAGMGQQGGMGGAAPPGVGAPNAAASPGNQGLESSAVAEQKSSGQMYGNNGP